MSNLKKISNKSFYLLSVVAYLTLIINKSSEILTRGRFFAEEGAVYWSYSLYNNIIDVLLYDPVGDGYYCLTCNFQILLTKLLPIQYSPLATVWSSILFAILPSYLFYRFAANHYEKKLYFSIIWLLLFLPSLNFLEVFANSINTQSYLAISIFIILLFSNGRELIRSQYLIIFLGFMSSYYSLAILPAFIFKYYRERKSWLLRVIFIGITSSTIQLNVFFYTLLQESLYSGRLQQKINFGYLVEILSHSISINFATERFYRLDLISNLILLIYLSMLLFLIIRKSFFTNLNFVLILLTYFFQIVLVYFGNPTQVFYGRYAVVSSTVIFFIYIEFIKDSKKLQNTIFVIILISLLNFRYQGGDYFIDCNEYCTSWPEQVELVKNNSLDKYIHWPIGEGEPYWFTDATSPKPNPAPFQKENIGLSYMDNYEISLIDILKINLGSLFNKDMK